MAATSSSYEETLRVPTSWWLLGVLFAVAIWWICLVAVSWPASLVAGLLALVFVLLGLGRYGGVRVAVDKDGFRAGPAVLDWPHVGLARALGREETRRALGVEADARAYLLLRDYCHGSVLVGVDDRADPAPYWLVSTRHPAELAAHIQARTRRDGDRPSEDDDRGLSPE
ncbi:MAG: DUF3093 domain-containing protein [Nocardioidaceae bacterium]